MATAGTSIGRGAPEDSVTIIETEGAVGGGSVEENSAKKSRKEKKSKKRKRTKDTLSSSLDNYTPTGHPAEEASPPKSASQPSAPTVSSVAPKKKRKKKRKKDRRVKKPVTAVTEKEPPEKPKESTASPPRGTDDVHPVPDPGDGTASAITFPFPTDPDDHCESPLQAYAHIQPFLQQVAKTMGRRDTKDLRIYDPYYCNGAVIENLTSLGFPSVYNKKEDCYQTWASTTLYPSFDVLVTNPPYSGDHIEKLVHHLTSPRMTGRPWFLLMPEWVHKKAYFLSNTKSQQIQPFYLVPKKRYVYLPPKDYRASKKSDVHKKSSPFNSMWYIWGGTREGNDKLMRYFYNSSGCTFPADDTSESVTGPGNTSNGQRMPLSDACELARSKSALRDLRRKHATNKNK